MEPEPNSTTGLLEDHFNDLNTSDSGQSSTSEDGSSVLKSICTQNALLTGRPKASVLVIIVGISGAGKSTLLNKLFRVPNNCPNNELPLHRRKPFVLEDFFNVQGSNQQMITKWSVVDLPGILETKEPNDTESMNHIHNFFSGLADLKARPFIGQSVSEAPCNVFPNVILYTVSATENRIVGSFSTLRKSLERLKSIGNLVDTERPNLVVVLTHVCALGLVKTDFQKNLAERKTQISNVVFEVFGIKDVVVVPIENKPENYGLKKTCNNEYVLPNGEIMFQNLLTSVLNIIDQNKDALGRLCFSANFTF